MLDAIHTVCFHLWCELTSTMSTIELCGVTAFLASFWRQTNIKISRDFGGPSIRSSESQIVWAPTHWSDRPGPNLSIDKGPWNGAAPSPRITNEDI